MMSAKSASVGSECLLPGTMLSLDLKGPSMKFKKCVRSMQMS